jgi:hypothetical protein
MLVEILDHDTQRFNGRTYTRFGNYFRYQRTFLHRVVWEFYNGPIVAGHHIHHKDHDGSSNQIENLESIEGSKHISDHRRKFASNAAKSAWRRACGVDNEHRICCGCDRRFSVNKHKKTRFCSQMCAAVSRRRQAA